MRGRVQRGWGTYHPKKVQQKKTHTQIFLCRVDFSTFSPITSPSSFSLLSTI